MIKYDAINYNEYTNDYGYWLNRIKWDWYTTLTFSDYVSDDQAYKYVYKWLRSIEPVVKHKIHYFMVIEPQRLRDDNPHFHILMFGVKYLNKVEWASNWTYGKKEIKDYDPEKGGHYYVTKYIYSGLAQYKFSKGLQKLLKLDCYALSYDDYYI